jgi:HEAT repeat protein
VVVSVLSAGCPEAKKSAPGGHAHRHDHDHDGDDDVRLIVRNALRSAVERFESLFRGPRPSPGEAEARVAVADAIADSGEVAAARVGELVILLGDPDTFVRAAAAEALAAVGPRTLPMLRALARHRDPALRAGAVLALGSSRFASEGDIALIAAAVSDPNVRVRAAAVGALGRLGPPAAAAVPALVAALSDVSLVGRIGSVREAAVSALLSLGPSGRKALEDGGVSKVAEGLSHVNPEVRLSAVRALEAMGPLAGPAVPVLAGRVRDWYPDVVHRSFATLALVGPAGRLKLAELCADPDPKVRRKAASVLTWSEGPLPQEAAAPLLKALADKDVEVRAAAADALGRIRPVAAWVVPALVDALEDVELMSFSERNGGDFDRTSAPADGLVRVGRPAVAALVGALKSSNSFRRLQAAIVLGRIGPRAADARGALDEAAAEPDFPGLHLAATLAAGRVAGDFDGLPELVVEQSRDGNALIRVMTAFVLEKMGPASAPVLTRLVAMLSDKEWPVRRRVAVAIAALGPASKPALPMLAQWVMGENPDERALAAQLLARLGPDAAPAVPALWAALRKPEPEIRKLAAAALSGIGPAAAPTAGDIVRALSEPPGPGEGWDYRRKLIDALGGIGPEAKEAVPLLADQLGKPGPGLAVDAIEALRRIGPAASAALPALRKIAARGDYPAIDAEVAIAHITRDAGPLVARLSAEAGKGRIGRRRWDALPLGVFRELTGVPGAEAAVPVLLGLATSDRESEYVRHESAAVLAALAPAEPGKVVPLLVARVRSSWEKGHVDARGISAIQSYGADAAPALPLLREIADTGSPRSSELARAAMEKIAKARKK